MVNLPSQPKTPFLEDISEAKAKYRALKSTSRALKLVVDNMHTVAPMGTHCLTGNNTFHLL